MTTAGDSSAGGASDSRICSYQRVPGNDNHKNNTTTTNSIITTNIVITTTNHIIITTTNNVIFRFAGSCCLRVPDIPLKQKFERGTGQRSKHRAQRSISNHLL